MGSGTETVEDALVLVTTGGIVGGALVVLSTAGYPEATLLARFGQLLFVVGFATGAVYFAYTDREWPAVGMAIIAVAWAVPFADSILRLLFGELFPYLTVAVVTIGLLIVLLGFKVSQPLREVLPSPENGERRRPGE